MLKNCDLPAARSTVHQSLTELGKLNSQITFGFGRFPVNVACVGRSTSWLAGLLLVVFMDDEAPSWKVTLLCCTNNSPLLKAFELLNSTQKYMITNGTIKKKNLICRRIPPRGDILLGCAMVGCFTKF
jgi:hypothetical protein